MKALQAIFGRFSALQRAEIAEIVAEVYVLPALGVGFSALQRAEIAEIPLNPVLRARHINEFQCSSTSRNC